MMDQKIADVTISIVTMNNRDLIKECLYSLYESIHKVTVRVFVIDNMSSDGTIEMLEKFFPQVRIIKNKCQLGFSANHNQILSKCKSRYYVIANDDIVILPGALDVMVSFMDENPRVGVCGVRLQYPDGSLQGSYGYYPTLLNELTRLVGLTKLFSKLSIDKLLIR